MTPIELNDSFVSDVRDSRVVLLLGAGASIGSSGPYGYEPLIGDGLRDAICDEFLGGEFKSEDLSFVSELAASETDLRRFQQFVARLFDGLEPADFHATMTEFKWHGIATTNYDRIVEKAYANNERAIQSIMPIISGDDALDEKIRSTEQIALLKLHGCVTRTNDPKLPLILTPDQYATHRDHRESLFDTFQEWASQHPVVFVGHAMRDVNLRAILLQVSQHIEFRPRYYFVSPNVSSQEVNFWAAKRVTVLDGTFSEFLQTLSEHIPQGQRPLMRVTTNEHPIMRKFIVTDDMSNSLREFLSEDVQFVHEGMEFESGTPQQFYKGFDLGWYPISEQLDVRRDLTDEVLFNAVVESSNEEPNSTEFHTLLAEAGAGKSVFLRRLAWEAAVEADTICLFLLPNAKPDFEMFREIYRVTQERIFLLIDSASDNLQLIVDLIEESQKSKIPLTLVSTERTNEWNMNCDEELSGYVTDSYSLPYLNEREIEALVSLLEQHDAQGPGLEHKTHQEKVQAFTTRAGRQLLVALHEATMGKPFEEILLDEYYGVHPTEARRLYLTVCFLNRLNAPVRAGLISRLHNIPFTRFQKEFFGPLSHVVYSRYDKKTRDYVYVARHTHIASIVFGRALSDKTERYNEYVRVLKLLNLSYTSDIESFKKLTQARTLENTFSNAEDVRAIYDVAVQSTGEDAFLYQQIAIFERRTGNLSRAHELLQKARHLKPRSTSILHSLADLARSQANDADRPLQKAAFRTEAYKLLNDMPTRARTDRYAQHTFVLLALDDLRDLLRDENSTKHSIDDSIRKVENVLERAQQRFPEEHLFKQTESRFATLLKNHDRARTALTSAFNRNPRDPYLATHLAVLHETEGDLKQSEVVLSTALEKNPDNQQLNFIYAETLRKIDPEGTENLLYHYRKSFTKWDEQYEAQFRYAMYVFESNDSEKWSEAGEIFRRLRESYMTVSTRNKIRAHSTQNGEQAIFTGTVSRIEVRHGFIIRDGRGDAIFFHKRHLSNYEWENLRRGQRLRFSLGFTFGGPQAIEAKPE